MQTESTNVVRLKTRKPLFPFQVRALLMAQYAESKERESSAEAFVKDFEEKFIATIAATAIDVSREFVADLLGRKKSTTP